MNSAFKSRIKNPERCQSCREVKFSTRKMKCPYAEDVHNETVIVELCDECEQEAIDDI